MLGIYVSVPIACFRKGLAREYLETEPFPPPATCYGFLLALVGETDREEHQQCRVCPALISRIERRPSVVLRTIWRVKDKKAAPGTATNARPDFQQLHTETELVIWLDSSDEPAGRPTLEDRVRAALEDPAQINRFGGLSMGESTHLVNDIIPVERWSQRAVNADVTARRYELAERGRRTMPVWVDHVGSLNTTHVVGDLTEPCPAGEPPERLAMPQITK